MRSFLTFFQKFAETKKKKKKKKFALSLTKLRQTLSVNSSLQNLRRKWIEASIIWMFNFIGFKEIILDKIAISGTSVNNCGYNVKTNFLAISYKIVFSSIITKSVCDVMLNFELNLSLQNVNIFQHIFIFQNNIIIFLNNFFRFIYENFKECCTHIVWWSRTRGREMRRNNRQSQSTKPRTLACCK